MIKWNRNFSNFHHFLGVYDPKVPTKSNQERLKLIFMKDMYWALYTIVSGNNYKGCSHIPPSGTMKLTSWSNQRYKRGQKSPLHPTALAGPLQSGYSLVHGRLKMWKMSKIVISIPPATWVKTNIWGNQPRGGVWGIPLSTFTSRNPDKQTFFFLVA